MFRGAITPFYQGDQNHLIQHDHKSTNPKSKDYHIRKSERSAMDAKVCELRVANVESKDLGMWR